MDTTMKDLMGVPTSVGDAVVITRTGYRVMTIGKVTKITPKGVKVSFPKRHGGTDETFRTSEMFVRVQKEG